MARPTTPCLNTGAEHLRKDGDDVESHGVLDPHQPVGNDDPAVRSKSTLDDGVPGRRDQVLDSALPADPDVIGRALQHLGDGPQLTPRARESREADHLVMVETAIPQGPGGILRDFEIAAAQQLGHRAVVDSPELHDQARLPRAAPLHARVRPLPAPGWRLVRTGRRSLSREYLDSSVQSVCPRHLPDPDHSPASSRGAPPLGAWRGASPWEPRPLEGYPARSPGPRTHACGRAATRP